MSSDWLAPLLDQFLNPPQSMVDQIMDETALLGNTVSPIVAKAEARARIAATIRQRIDCEVHMSRNVLLTNSGEPFVWRQFSDAVRELQNCECRQQNGVCDCRKAVSAAVVAITEEYGDDISLRHKSDRWWVAFSNGDAAGPFCERDAEIVAAYTQHLFWGHPGQLGSCTLCKDYRRYGSQLLKVYHGESL